MAKLSLASKDKQFFSVWVDEVKSAQDILEKNLDLAIKSLRASGMDDKAIFESLSNDLKGEKDLFASFSGGVEGADADLLHLESQAASADEVSGVAELFVWTLDPTAVDHCEDCLKNADADPMSFDDWEAQGLPGMGSTQCGEYCKCSLDPVGATE